MKFALFYHSIVSCWNNGNAHFTRGMARALMKQGHAVTVYEPWNAWSRRNLVADHGLAVLRELELAVADIPRRVYDPESLDLDAVLSEADVVIVHEWTDPLAVERLGERHRSGGDFLLLFHDTHHRGVTAPEEIDRLPLEGFDAVLAFGEALREVYERKGWGRRAYTLHEAADTTVFRPLADIEADKDLVWIGNWGDGERTRELHEFLIDPASDLALDLTIHGVRYPEAVRRVLVAEGVDYRGWLPNHKAPETFACARFTVHVPRRAYATLLPGIPTIRVFEALACGIPLISAPWSDCEGLFPEGCYAKAADGAAMRKLMREVMNDAAYRQAMAAAGLEAIRRRHTCDHRAAELLAIIDELKPPRPGAVPGSRQFREKVS